MKKGFARTEKGSSKKQTTILEIQNGVAQMEKGIAGMKKGVRQMASRLQKLKPIVGKLDRQLPEGVQELSAHKKSIAQVVKCLMALHGDSVPVIKGQCKYYAGNLRVLYATHPIRDATLPPPKKPIA